MRLKSPLIYLMMSFAQPPLFAQHFVSLSWTDPDNPPETTYNVYRLDGACPNIAPTDTVGFTKLNPMPLTVKQHMDTTVKGALTYCYVVTAFDGTTESQPSPPLEITVPPLAPQMLAGTPAD